ncbi:cell division inhibitor SepF [Bowdeniella nasicola]|uniref:Cell division protein SepF n=1 Tax=Bowdeniella nasicola TaxID=208480 RepID=A0A1H4B983_9ACTO|nr:MULTISPECIES: cell division protein SepF [Bowdeniella]SEA44699.1 cell division inhibitor SepF [Bowdeniella nasicola]
MAGFLRKSMEYLALSQPEEETEEVYDDFTTDIVNNVKDTVDETPAAPVTPIHRAASAGQRFDVHENTSSQELSRIVTFHPTAYNEAKVIGTAFREGIPVILNLSGMSEADGKRMLDFCSGLAYGLEGGIEKVTQRVFLLSPATVEVYRDAEDSDPVKHLG